MHVLLTNDDGPLDDVSCPYIKYLVDEIHRATDWDLSIVVPNQQRSWIGKAHFAGKTVTARYIYTEPSTDTENSAINAFEGPFDTPQPELAHHQEWCLIDSTPACCADIGIHHLYTQRKNKPVDLVISGPNFGKNSGNLYILTSGTVGAAMEAVTHGVKSVALSYAFFGPNHDHRTLREAARISVKLIAKLYRELERSQDVDIFSINVPLLPSLELGKTDIHYAPILENYWNSIYTPVDGPHHQFRWQPDFTKVHRDGELDHRHTDSRVLLNEGISVTPLKAAFHPVAPLTGRISLDEDEVDAVAESVKRTALDDGPGLYVTLPESSYVFQPIVNGFHGFHRVASAKTGTVFHYGDYEELDWDRVRDPDYYTCSYVYRKALIRKNYLANTVAHWVAKHPQSVLKRAVPESYQLEVDYAEFLDDALDEAYELRSEIEAGDKTWILKPAMADKAQGIRVFRTVDELQAVFDSFDEDDTDDEGGDDDTGVIISQLRHFIVQEYMARPLLLANYGDRKFHLRVYVVCQGDLTVYVYRHMLALFAGASYDPESADMAGHLTNTCVQEGDCPLVVPFWQLHDPCCLNRPQMQKIYQQVCDVTGELFRAAVNVDKMNFQPLPNALEVFGVDFLVNYNYSVSLLEVNAYPDFKQTGDELKWVIDELFEAVGDVAYELVTKQETPKPQLTEVYRGDGVSS
ncbi:probable tubulin--tyrosine ligase Pby1p [Diutina catenulata]